MKNPRPGEAKNRTRAGQLFAALHNGHYASPDGQKSPFCRWRALAPVNTGFPGDKSCCPLTRQKSALHFASAAPFFPAATPCWWASAPASAPLFKNRENRIFGRGFLTLRSNENAQKNAPRGAGRIAGHGIYSAVRLADRLRFLVGAPSFSRTSSPKMTLR